MALACASTDRARGVLARRQRVQQEWMREREREAEQQLVQAANAACVPIASAATGFQRAASDASMDPAGRDESVLAIGAPLVDTS